MLRHCCRHRWLNGGHCYFLHRSFTTTLFRLQAAFHVRRHGWRPYAMAAAIQSRHGHLRWALATNVKQPLPPAVAARRQAATGEAA